MLFIFVMILHSQLRLVGVVLQRDDTRFVMSYVSLFAFNVKQILKYWTQCAGRIYMNSTHFQFFNTQSLTLTNIVWSLSSVCLLCFVLCSTVFSSALAIAIDVCVRWAFEASRSHTDAVAIVFQREHMLVCLLWAAIFFIAQQVRTSWFFLISVDTNIEIQRGILFFPFQIWYYESFRNSGLNKSICFHSKLRSDGSYHCYFMVHRTI